MVELPRRGEIAPERLLDDDTRAAGQPFATEPLDHGREQRGRDGQVVHRMTRTAQDPPQRLERAGVAVVTIDVLHQRQQPVQGSVAGAGTGLRDAVPRMVTKLRKTPPRGRDPHDRNGQRSPLHHPAESRKDHLAGEITRRAEEHEGIGRDHALIAVAHHQPFPSHCRPRRGHEPCTPFLAGVASPPQIALAAIAA